MVVPGKSSVKLRSVLATAQSCSELCLLLNVAMAWQHPQPWQSSIAPCKMTCLIFSQNMLCFSAVNEVLFVTARPVLGPLANHLCFLH